MKTLPGFPLVEGNHVTLTARLLMFVVVKFGATGAESTRCETGVRYEQQESHELIPQVKKAKSPRCARSRISEIGVPTSEVGCLLFG